MMYFRSVRSRNSRSVGLRSPGSDGIRLGRPGLALVVEGAGVGILGQIGDGDHVAGEDHGALDHVLQLPDVARIAAQLERGEHLGIEALLLEPVLLAERRDEGVGEGADVLHPLAQRGAADGEHRQPEV